MIATDRVPTATHFGPESGVRRLVVSLLALWGLGLVAGACVSLRPAVTGPRQVNLQTRLGDERARMRDLEREIAASKLVRHEQQAEADQLVGRQRETHELVQKRTQELDRELSQLAALEQDLVAARGRSAEIIAAKAELERLKTEVTEQEKQVKDLDQRLAALEAARVSRAEDLVKRETEAALHVANAEARIADLAKRGAALLEAFSQLRAALPKQDAPTKEDAPEEGNPKEGAQADPTGGNK